MWHPRETIPTNRKIDVWCVDPWGTFKGVRFTDVEMRGDGSGFGFVWHNMEGVVWEYLERAEGVFPVWIITHWMEIPEGPIKET